MRVGIIGLGRAGRVHLDAWRAVPRAEVAAICDPVPAVRRSARAEGLAAYAEPAEMLERAPLDAVSICSPPAFHAPIALACFGRGLDVLCEKPLAINGRAALRMAQAATRGGRVLLLATKFRHVPDLAVARELVAAGEIGEPVAFEIDFSSMVDMSGRWNAKRALAGGGVIIDNGCHAFDIVSYLFGTVTRVHATRLKAVQDIPVEDSATILVAAGRGLVGRIDLSWSLQTGRETYVTIYGSRGTIEVGWRGSRLKAAGKEPRAIGPGYDKNEAHRRMMEAFVSVVAGTAQPWISPGEGLRTVAAVEAAYHSLRSGGWVPVDTMGLCDTRSRAVRRARA
ncbi:MAG TPA: Gfo/Idh/MocA family oxidoreductase [Candidatus Binatia bacterium]|nr:Gfo/Idh/MocA family oxidoreductase [Candidatus Binatia bacterium]